jgi:very-short-patch-repair endonuclease
MANNSARINRARELRQRMTPAELILWRQLRGRRFANLKFRRQHPIGPYVADFYCHECKLIIELDGETHFGRENADQLRQSEIETCGYTVIRFTNSQLYEDLETVLELILTECTKQTLTPIPSPAKPGEGK